MVFLGLKVRKWFISPRNINYEFLDPKSPRNQVLNSILDQTKICVKVMGAKII